MRHRKQKRKLSMMRSHRNATLRNMVRSLIEHQRIQTTLVRAKEARRLAEPLITIGKEDTVAARRRAYSILAERDLVVKLFKEIAPLFKGRKGGYTRIIPLGFRRGDGAHLAILELTERKIEEKVAKKKKDKAKEEQPKEGVVRSSKPHAAQGQATEKAQAVKAQAATQDEAVRQTAGTEAHRREPSHPKKEEPKAKAIPKSKPTLEEEKKTERAKAEQAKLGGKKGFVKNLRGFFRRKSDT